MESLLLKRVAALCIILLTSAGVVRYTNRPNTLEDLARETIADVESVSSERLQHEQSVAPEAPAQEPEKCAICLIELDPSLQNVKGCSSNPSHLSHPDCLLDMIESKGDHRWFRTHAAQCAYCRMPFDTINEYQELRNTIPDDYMKIYEHILVAGDQDKLLQNLNIFQTNLTSLAKLQQAYWSFRIEAIKLKVIETFTATHGADVPVTFSERETAGIAAFTAVSKQAHEKIQQVVQDIKSLIVLATEDPKNYDGLINSVFTVKRTLNDAMITNQQALTASRKFVCDSTSEPQQKKIYCDDEEEEYTHNQVFRQWTAGR